MDWMVIMEIKFFIPGVPATAGSKTPFIYRSKKDGKQRVAMAPANKRQKPWMSDVKYYAEKAMAGSPPTTRAVVLWITFYFPRPKSHFGSGKNSAILKPSAPKELITKPDLTKAIRCLEDSLTGVVWKDDSQVVEQHTRKEYGDRPGALIEIRALGI